MHVAVLSFTSIDADHRVQRSIAALAERGHRVTAIGFGGQPAVPCAFIALPPLPSRTLLRLGTLLTQAPAGLVAGTALPLHFLWPHHRAARSALIALRPDAVHANDCLSLPSAVAAKHATGARVVYDSHEFATEEHADNIRWRLVAQSHVRAIERRFIGDADHVVTVSDGIARDLQALYDLPARPVVVRNTPAYQATAPRPATPPRHLLFHGIMKGGRGIEATIAALRHLPEAVLTLRGNGAPLYLAGLRAQAERQQSAHRVRFEPAVPSNLVVPQAAEAHIGVFCAPAETRHNRFAMPNKIFEYLMAGLAVVVRQETDLAELVARYRCGVTAEASNPEAIAAAVAAITPGALQTMRANALAAARELSWEREQINLTRLYDGLSTESPPAVAPVAPLRLGARAARS